MSRIGNIVKSLFTRSYENPNVPLPPAGNFLTHLGGKSESGAVVNKETALMVATVWRCVNLISSTVARLPIDIFKIEESGLVKNNRHSLYKLLSVEPSGFYTPFIFFERIVSDLCLSGNSFVKIIRNAREEIVELRLIRTEVEVYIFEGNLLYKIKGVNGAKEEVLFPSDILHFVGFGDSPILGKSPIAVNRESIGISISSRDYASNLYGNGGFISGVIETDKPLKTEQKQAIVNSFRSAYAGAKNAGKIAALDFGFKYKPITISPSDIEYIQTQRYQTIEIAKIFGVPPHKVFDLEKATQNNMEVMNSGFLETINSYTERIEQELRRKLFNTLDKTNHVIRFNLYELSRGDMKARTDYYRNRFNTGSLTPNQIRQYEGENKSEAPGMDNYYLQVNMSPVEKLNQNIEDNE